MARDGYRWWIRRLTAAGQLYDMVRLDHFRGFEAYWSVPYGDSTARNGKWVKGPGMNLIHAIKAQLPELKLIAEDLGMLTQEVLDLREASGMPGMKVLQFAFDSEEPSVYLPHTYIQNTVCYTGTHDNMTMGQWFASADAKAVAYARDYMSLTEQEGFVWGAIRTMFSSVSDLCIAQMQDFLELGAEARMNIPGTAGGNWQWRADPGSFGDALAAKIRRLTKLYGRLADNK
jgi:4-alpha-glucanotransferase